MKTLFWLTIVQKKSLNVLDYLLENKQTNNTCLLFYICFHLLCDVRHNSNNHEISWLKWNLVLRDLVDDTSGKHCITNACWKTCFENFSYLMVSLMNFLEHLWEWVW